MSSESMIQREQSLPGVGRLGRAQATCDRFFAALDAVEVNIVSRAVSSAESSRLDSLARAATRIGDGWVYPLLAAFVVAAGLVETPLRFLTCAGVSVVSAFAVYPLIKRFLQRMRPCDYDRTLARDLGPIDRYSCPSGHTMTAAAFGTTLLIAIPEAAPLAVGLTVLIGWSRVALGHHYVTDVLAGAFLGSAIAVATGAILS